ncbi:glycosyltransferase family 4 protein [Pseudozobellia thermophila]|uniref:GalNAc-alpha-(1->4)-GalNAc-alpha-(1->3)-diNAcBac-PP-undecaprenol alpha-1,4-N-acetyl-D-galactosaminyltransferase n=1 Tax=Pseudozobellia thermophila TaxID=192903 RepID=A0A1M6IVT8_9FLAO|nr:glycosyltransferase family 4 protein [Pseudozobellia thermophila]SHJ38570.1 GalNAc-alpha-(1->4)-GalNAc-alpha-(1->3)-diNAcBac-PP-undecaprenol alpha-1,4-N-acetyl-D-galactosaminyltransferase [Pseudozobellia thermophila]
MKRKKIAFVIYNLESGGAERVITELANNFVNNFEVFIITLVKTDPFYELNPNVNLLYCSEKVKKHTNPIKSIIDGMSRVSTLSKIIKRNKIQLVIGFMTTSNIYAIWASKLCHIPCIISERANHSIYKLPKLQTFVRDISYKLCNYLVVQTDANRQFYSSKLSPSKIIVIPNPIATALTNKRNLQLNKPKDNIILNVGSFKKGKAQELLISAFSNIKKEGWKIVFVGDGPTKQKNLDLTKELNLENRISFVGKQQNVHEFYNRASLFVFTSEHEGFPNALLEALYFGIPTISTNCEHGPSELIVNQKNGFLIPVGDQDMLEQKMVELMENETLQYKFKENAMKSTESYQLDFIANIWRNYIEKLV